MRTVALSEVVDFYSGGTPSKANEKFWNGPVPWFSAKDMKQPRLRDSADHVSESVFSATSLRKLPPGTVAIVVRGMILAHTVPISILDVDAAINQDLKALIPRRDVDPTFLAAMLRAQHSKILAQVSTAAHGTKKLDSRVLDRIRIPLPPLNEQRRIAAILDHADALRAKRRQVLAHLDLLARSIYNETFAGSWPTRLLGDVASTTSGGTPDRSVAEHYDGEVPWVKSGELHDGVVTRTEESISALGLASSSARLLPAGTVLVAMYGATAGTVGMLGIEATTNQAVCAITPGPEVDSTYLISLLRSMNHTLLSRRSGGAQPNLNQGTIRSLEIRVPPLALQRRFASCIRDLEEHALRLRDSTSTYDDLFASLQARAFRNKL